jgi:putative endonuclease
VLKNSSSKKTGDLAEDIAKQHLAQHGLSFICSNFYSRFGEIDLIFRDDQVLVFIEVRYRKNNRYGSNFETINKKKQDKIIKTAEFYLYKNKITESINCRFDVIGIEPTRMKPTGIEDKNIQSQHSINWIKNAFSCF